MGSEAQAPPDAVLEDGGLEELAPEDWTRKVRDQFKQALAHKSCGRFAITRKDRWGRIHLIRLRCMSWSCERCRRILSRRWLVRIQTADCEWSAMMTLTLDPRSLTVAQLTDLDEQRNYTCRAWNSLRRWMVRRFGKLRYVAFREWQPRTGRLHLHVLVADLGRLSRPDFTDLVCAVDRCGFGTRGGRMVVENGRRKWRGPFLWEPLDGDIRKVTAYVTKYLTKQHPLSYQCRIRRINASRDLLPALKPMCEPVPEVWDGPWSAPRCYEELKRDLLETLTGRPGKHEVDEYLMSRCGKMLDGLILTERDPAGMVEILDEDEGGSYLEAESRCQQTG